MGARRRVHYLKASTGRTACGYDVEWFGVASMTVTLADATCRGCLKCAPEPWHGTSGGYTNHACHCAACTAANRERMADWRAAHRGMEPPKHNEHGYNAYGCRCPVCSADHAARMAAWREANRDRARV
jgi:hypothetical protein